MKALSYTKMFAVWFTVGVVVRIFNFCSSVNSWI